MVLGGCLVVPLAHHGTGMQRVAHGKAWSLLSSAAAVRLILYLLSPQTFYSLINSFFILTEFSIFFATAPRASPLTATAQPELAWQGACPCPFPQLPEDKLSAASLLKAQEWLNYWQ